MTMFKREKSFFIEDVKQYRGIHCRFGMAGVIAEAHFDGGQNMIAMLKGEKRYMMMPPDQCENIYLLKKGHPSGRHSEVDWSEVDQERFPLFPQAVAFETILKEGQVEAPAAPLRRGLRAHTHTLTHAVRRACQVLFVPSYWIHYIVSLDTSVQCNCRSGTPATYLRDVQKCGFYPGRSFEETMESRKKN